MLRYIILVWVKFQLQKKGFEAKAPRQATGHGENCTRV